MLQKIFLPTILLVLAYGFWISPDFKEISAGLAIFLFGMLSLEQGFRAFAGGLLEKLLKRTTDKLWKSLSFGIIATSLMQSSSLVSVITISFLSSGLIDLMAGVGIIFGANLGTTTGAWLVAGLGLKVKISSYAMPLLVFGVIFVFQKHKIFKGIGYTLAGIGFLFLGIHHMKEGFEAFKDIIDLSQFAVSGYPGLFIFAFIGVLATVIMQSSHATLVLIITALATQQITYENALALAIGANVGTTITAIIGSLGANEQGKRLAAAHLVFNMVTGVVAILFITQFIRSVDYIALWTGIADSNYTLKLAIFHTLFNFAGIIIMLPFIEKMVDTLETVIKDKVPRMLGPKYLDSVSIDFPETALEAVRNETLHVYDNAAQVIAHGISLKLEDIFSDRALEQAVIIRSKPIEFNIDEIYEKNIKGIYSAIIAFISKASFSWDVEQSSHIHWIRNANRNIVEAVKAVKHLRKNMIRFIQSHNPHIRNEYNQLRIQIAHVMRELEDARRAPEADASLFDALRLSIKENDDQLNIRLIQLLHEGKITPEMGTSLMNDSNYTFRICRNLIEMAETLFLSQNTEEAKAARQVALDDDELDQLLEKNQSDPGSPAP